MFTLHCTQRLLARLNASPPADAIATPPTTRLGDWYANTVKGSRPQLVLFVSERALLPVIVEAAPKATLMPRFREALRDVLRAIGVDEPAITEEDHAMAEVVFGRTANRRVVGSMNEFAAMLDWYIEDEGGSFHGAALRLARYLCGPIRPKTPREVTIEIFKTVPIPPVLDLPKDPPHTGPSWR